MTGRAIRTSRTIRTIGVEEELMLVDAETFCPAPVAGNILLGDGASEHLRPALLPGTVLELELKHEQIEVVSPPLRTLDELNLAIVGGRRAADAAARTAGARAVALGTATMPCTPHLVSAPRYERMRESYGLTLDEQLTCGFHVHVAIESAEEGVAVLDRMRAWLPLILALSANSPFWQGIDTGYASFRYQAWCRWPSAGPFDVFGSSERYEQTVADMLASEVALDAGMIYFDARLSSHAPTVETRIADVCLRPEDAAAIAVLIRALVEVSAAEWRAGLPADDVPTSLLRLASWRASKSGVAGALIHPQTRHPVDARVAVEALLDHVDDGWASEEERQRVRAVIGDILGRGTGADRQRDVRSRVGSCAGVIAAAADDSLGEADGESESEGEVSARQVHPGRQDRPAQPALTALAAQPAPGLSALAVQPAM